MPFPRVSKLDLVFALRRLLSKDPATTLLSIPSPFVFWRVFYGFAPLGSIGRFARSDRALKMATASCCPKGGTVMEKGLGFTQEP